MGIFTDFPDRLNPGTQVYVGEDKYIEQTIISIRPHAKGLLIGFEGYDSREDVGVLRNELVFVHADDRPPLPAGEYYHHQLIGLTVVTDEQENLGIIIDILETGANDVYIVQNEEGVENLLPAIDEVVLEINIEKTEMRVHLLPGLISK